VLDIIREKKYKKISQWYNSPKLPQKIWYFNKKVLIFNIAESLDIFAFQSRPPKK
jgi:hypothetical protein